MMNRFVTTMGRITLMTMTCVAVLPVASCGKPSATQLAEGAEAQYRLPSYVHKERFEEYPVVVNKGGEWPLPGTLTIPKGKGPFPAVVLVHGSGPEDRDETIGPNKPFKDIAWGLASRGVAVLRYDKRTFVWQKLKPYSAKLLKEAESITLKEEVIDDALAAVEVLRQSQRIAPDKIFVLGHSLGGILMPRIGKADPRIAGLIVMAACTRPYLDAYLEAIMYIASLSGPMTDDTKKEIDKYKEQIATLKSMNPSDKSTGSSQIMGAPTSYWLDLHYNIPAEIAKSLKQPMFIIQGGREYHATSVDFKIWKDAVGSRANVALKLYPDLNHLFMTGTGKETPAEYALPGTVAEVVVSDIGDWINGQ